MKIRKIKDIRLFDENRFTYIKNPSIHIFLERLVLKLREQNFSLNEEFDHLYISFTRKISIGQIERLDNEIDFYHKWFRYCLIGISERDYQELEQKSIDWFLKKVEFLLINAYAKTNEEKNLIKSAVKEVRLQKENFQTIFKEKVGRYNIARIYLRIDESGNYLPRLEIKAKDGIILLNKELSKTSDFCEFGKIQLFKDKVVIFPRKNYYAEFKNLKPMTFYFYEND